MPRFWAKTAKKPLIVAVLLALLTGSAFSDPFYLNPYSTNPAVSAFSITSIPLTTPISPKNGFSFVFVLFSIKNSDGLLVYQNAVHSSYTGNIELFYTEDSVGSVSIPAFSWNGSYLDADKRNIPDAIDGRPVPDGSYTLTIEFLNDKPPQGMVYTLTKLIARDSNGYKIGNFSPFEIVVDTHPDEDFAINTITSSGAYYIYGKGTADTWIAEIYNTRTNEQYGLYEYYNTLPVFPEDGFSPTSDGWIVQVTTRDRAYNESAPKIIDLKQIPSIILGTTEKIVEIEKVVEVTPISTPQSPEIILKANAQAILNPREPQVLSCFFVTETMDEDNIEWTIELYDSAHKHIKTLLQGIGFVAGANGQCYWDGYDKLRNHILKSAEIYTVVLHFEDGREYRANVASGIMLKRAQDGKLYIDVPDIIFPSYSRGFLDNQKLLADNAVVINKLARMLIDNIDAFDILEIHGNANPTTYPNKRAMERENEATLKKLSLERAQYVSNILVLCGVPAEKIKSFGDGGLRYEATPSNNAVNWKNRRVRFAIQYKPGNKS
jgi:hypothetical protein